MRIIALCIGLILSTILLFADDQNVDFDNHTDFSTLRTFALREGKVDSSHPELSNPLVVRKVGDAVRAALIAKGLRETANSPDIFVDYSISGEDFAAQRGGPAAFSQGTLVIDLVKRDSKSLVWRAVYRDNERNNAKLAQNLSNDARKLLSAYPPRQKGAIEPGASTPIVRQVPTPKAAAAAGLEIVNATRQQTAFVGPGVHPGLSVSLNNLERTAQTVANDDGSIPAAVENRISAFKKAMQETIGLANAIAGRSTETPDSRAKARVLAEKLLSLLGS